MNPKPSYLEKSQKMRLLETSRVKKKQVMQNGLRTILGLRHEQNEKEEFEVGRIAISNGVELYEYVSFLGGCAHPAHPLSEQDK